MEDFIFENIGKLLVAAFALLIGLMLWADSASCKAKWEGSGNATRWGIISGCQVQRDDGKWLPSDVMRETDA